MTEFAGRVAIVTGSSSGIGEETARRLSGLGATVVVNSSSSVEAGEAVSASLPGESCYLRADISNQDEAHRLIDDRRAVRATRLPDQQRRMDHLDPAREPRRPHRRDLPEDLRRQRVRYVVADQAGDPAPAQLRRRQHRQHHLDRRPPTGRIVDGVFDDQGGAQPDDAAVGEELRPDPGQRRRARSGGDTVDRGLGRHARCVAQMAPVPRSATPDDCAEAVLALLRNKYTTGEIFVVDGGTTLKM
jgi:ketoreductase RED2